MNKILRDDVLELVKRFKRAKNEREKMLCAKDLSNILDAAEIIQGDIDTKMLLPKELTVALTNLDKEMEKEKKEIAKQIYDNLDTLEVIYNTFLDEFRKYGFKYDSKDECRDVDLDMYHDFFKQFGNMDQEYTKVLNNEQLFMTEGGNAGSTINFQILGKQYVFVSIEDYVYAAKSLAHEMGHVHAFNITYNDNIDDYNLLTEFMSFLIELCFFNYEDANLSNQENINLIFVMGLLVYQSLGQIKLMKRHPDAFVNFKLNPKYEKELDEILRKLNYKHERGSLYSQLYSIDYLLAFNYFYQLKYGVDFNEVEKFYIENISKNNLSELLQHIDMDAIKQYLNELHLNRQNKKR